MSGIICRGITKVFNEAEPITVLRGVDVEMPAEKLTMLVGPSGCGKTTLLSIISGILSHTSGDVIINGTTITTLSNDEKVKYRLANLGFIFQQYNLLPSLTLAENVAIPLIIQGIPRKEAIRRSRELLAELGLEKMTERLPSQISGGQQQRVAIGRALVHKPPIIVCDEPTAALDETTGLKVMEYLRKATKERKCTVVVVTHDYRIFHFADQIAYMNDGLITDVKLLSQD